MALPDCHIFVGLTRFSKILKLFVINENKIQFFGREKSLVDKMGPKVADEVLQFEKVLTDDGDDDVAAFYSLTRSGYCSRISLNLN